MTGDTNPYIAIGLMSGTSADGIDGVVLKITDTSLSILEHEYMAYGNDLRWQVRNVCERKISNPEEAGDLDEKLCTLYAGVSQKLIDKIAPMTVSVIGSHGQTVHHSPYSSPPYTVQLGNGYNIAQLTGTPVVSDFRSRDMAAGGQGAPLAAGFHQAAFHSTEEHRAVINIGGIANITLLPACHSGDIIGFDIGPGNTLIDNWCQRNYSLLYDEDGQIARSGTVQLDLLDLLLKDDYFCRLFPKSTGPEVFSLTWLMNYMQIWGNQNQCRSEDILATLTALSARSIANVINDFQPKVGTTLLCGGGTKNSLLVDMISNYADSTITDTGTMGVDPMLVEAAAFAWMAYKTMQGQTSTLPSVTGARYPCIAGNIACPPVQTA